MPTLTYLVAASLDGFIAGPNGEIDQFNPDQETLAGLIEAYPETLPTPARQALKIEAPNRHFDTVLMGRATYQVGANQGLVSPYDHLRQYVISTSLDAPANANIEVVRREPAALARQLKKQNGIGIWLCGGGRLAGALADEIDDVIIKRHPTLLGAGVPIVDGSFSLRRFKLTQRSDIGELSVEHYRRA